MFPHLKGFNLKQWIDENRNDWGQRRVIWQDSDFIAFVTRGPNRRKDITSIPGMKSSTNSKANSICTISERIKNRKWPCLKPAICFFCRITCPIRRGDGRARGLLWWSASEKLRSGTDLFGSAKTAETSFTKQRCVLTIRPMLLRTRHRL